MEDNGFINILMDDLFTIWSEKGVIELRKWFNDLHPDIRKLLEKRLYEIESEYG